MFGDTWLHYFQNNARSDRTPAPSLAAEVSQNLRPALIDSLGRFQLGESAGGRIHTEIAHHPDPALDPGTRRAVQLYIEEEWRHARELALIIHALGGKTQTAHWTNDAFTWSRRILGLRTKLMTLAVAEVIGIVYYRALAHAVGSPALAEALERIAGEEARHLDFQAAFFEHAIGRIPRRFRPVYRTLLQVLLCSILSAATCELLFDHGKLLRRLGVSSRVIMHQAVHELASRRFLAMPYGRFAQSKHCSKRSTFGALMAHSNALRDTSLEHSANAGSWRARVRA